MHSWLFTFLAVVLPALLVYLLFKNKTINLKLMLAFSGAYLLSMTIFELLPIVYDSDLNTKVLGLFIMLGALLQIFLEFFSKGAEHGHLHISTEPYNFPLLLFTSLGVHAFLEGFAISDTNNMIFGIIVHKIPIAILITSFVLQSNFKRNHKILFILAFALMTPLGTLGATQNSFLFEHSTYITALVIGIFLHISTVILFENSNDHSFNLNKVLVIILAIGLAYLT